MFHSSGTEKFLHALFVAFECPYKSAFIRLAARKKVEKKKKNIYDIKVFFLFVRNNLALTKESHLEKRGEVKIKGTYLLL